MSQKKQLKEELTKAYKKYFVNNLEEVFEDLFEGAIIEEEEAIQRRFGFEPGEVEHEALHQAMEEIKTTLKQAQ